MISFDNTACNVTMYICILNFGQFLINAFTTKHINRYKRNLEALLNSADLLCFEVHFK